MQSEISVTKAALIISIVGAIFSIVIFIQARELVEKNIDLATEIPTLTKVNKKVLLDQKRDLLEPVFLKIPKIAVNASIESVGLTSTGAMGIPRNPMNVGWFNLGPKPGAQGSAVIDGHLDFREGVGAVFYKLDTLVFGDKVYVMDGEGNQFIFVVREVKFFGDKDNASSVFGSVDTKSHLNLITCAGILDEVTKKYSHRLVVFLDREGQ
jgi:LPXTG-site transpeptidase (sortase) family protein